MQLQDGLIRVLLLWNVMHEFMTGKKTLGKTSPRTKTMQGEGSRICVIKCESLNLECIFMDVNILTLYMAQMHET
jgi:hypothetical protein